MGKMPLTSSWYHVVPTNDLEEHDCESFDCKCNPDIHYDDMMVVHNAFDKRDVLEEISGLAFNERGKEDE